MNPQFVSCSDQSCPFNEQKGCRSPFIIVVENGKCSIRESGPFDNKASIETYVDIKECRCQKCHHWELDEATNIGRCGFADSLFFNQYRNEPLGPICNTFEKQVQQPGFSAPNV